MSTVRAVTDQRRATRAQLNLPVRIRWQAPLGPCIETAETLDVSRSGLLFYRTHGAPDETRPCPGFGLQPGVACRAEPSGSRATRRPTALAAARMRAMRSAGHTAWWNACRG